MAFYKAKKAGLALAGQKKMDERYDVVDGLGAPQNIYNWITAILGPDCGSAPGGPQWRKMQFWLRDGVVLCKLINKLRESASMPVMKFTGNAHIPVVAMENIENFNKAAVEYGVPQSASFPSSDLYDGTHRGIFLKVINFLNELGYAANQKGFSPQYQHVQIPTNDVHT